MRPVRVAVVGGAAVLALAGCGDRDAGAAPAVSIGIAGQQVALRPTQYCSGGSLHRYTVTPPVIAAPPGARVTFRVPAAVAAQGWSVQVFDQQLEQEIGEVDAGRTTTFDRITTSDVASPGFYLVVAEHGGTACHGLAGAWPVGIIRAAGPSASAGGTPTAPGGTPTPSGQG